MKRILKPLIICLSVLLLAGCEKAEFVVNDIDEREANEIIVFLASKNIDAQKVKVDSSMAGGTGPSNMWSITVDTSDETKAMAYLNQAGLPRRQGTNLLQLFAKQGLMSSDKEENIRFQAGLAEQLKNTIRKMDGVLDASVEISFPLQDNTVALPGANTVKEKIRAAVYVKHQGVLDDPNNQLETKIKRLLAGSVQGLEFDNVAVISDRARLADISPYPPSDMISAGSSSDHVSVWGIVMPKSSLAKFRFIFFTLTLLVLVFGGFLCYFVWKNYPELLQKVRLPKKLTKKKAEPEPPESL